MQEKTYKNIRRCCYILFCIYIAVLFYFLFFAEMAGRMDANRTYHYNLVLFKEIGRFIKYRHLLGPTVVFLNLIGNIFIFVPFGMLVPVLSRRFKGFWMVVLLSFELSLAVEIIQLLAKVGCCDVDDILLNTIGGMIGFVCYGIIRRKGKKLIVK